MAKRKPNPQQQKERRLAPLALTLVKRAGDWAELERIVDWLDEAYMKGLVRDPSFERIMTRLQERAHRLDIKGKGNPEEKKHETSRG